MAPGHRQLLEQREDMRLAHSSMKVMRSLCREYGIPFQMPNTSVRDASARKPRSSRSNASSGAASPESTSSSSSDVEEKQDDGESFARWPAVQELLQGLHMGTRVKVLKEISKSLNESAERAEKSMRDFDARAARAGSRASNGGAERPAVVNEELLRFDAEETAAAQAVKRCQALMPELKQRAMERAEASKASIARALREAEALKAEAQEASDSDGSDEVKQNDVERRFAQLGELPPGAHPDLQTVLDLQREEIRATAQRIKDAERDLQVTKYSIEYVDGKLNLGPDADHELLNASISLAQEMKAGIYARQREDAEQKLLQEQKRMNVPTEEEVQEQVAESERLQQQVSRAAEQVRRLQELSAAAVNPPAEQPSAAPAGSREGSPEEGEAEEGQEGEEKEQKPLLLTDQIMRVQEGAEGAPRVVVDLSRVAEVHRELSKEVSGLEEQISVEDKRISQAESVMKNAEQTLKVLEEAKTLLLEHVAREKPALVEGLLPPPEVPEDPEEDADHAGSSTPSSDSAEEEEAEDEEEAAERLKSLAREELRIRTQLAEAVEAEKAANEGGTANSSEDEVEGGGEGHGATQGDYGVRCARGLRTLALRLREDPDAGASADVEEGGDGGSAASDCPRAWTPPEDLTREEAILQLRSMPHAELKALLKLRNDNERLMKQVEQARRELERLRVKQGNPKALLALESQEAALEQGVPPELVVEVRRKVRELCALRKRWWRDRQDESTTVRRSLAAVDLPEDANTDDRPPPVSQDSIFQRIRASMTLP